MSPTRPPAAAELRFPAMGTDVHLLVVGGSRALPAAARRRIEDLESRWSRFRPDSEISRLNARTGLPIPVSAETRLLVRCAVMGWQRSHGLFDPTIHDALVAAGYDRDLRLVHATPARPGPARPAPGCDGVTVDDRAGTVTLPVGVRLDPGGIGKGLAADLVVTELREAGAAGVCANLGGDLRVAGTPPDGPGWRIAVPAPHGGEPVGILHLVSGAVATSSTLDRRWLAGDVEQHHLIDPATGRPSTRQRVATVVAANGWEAEVAAKVAVLADADRRDRLLPGLAAGALVIEDAASHAWGAIDRFLEPSQRRTA